LEKPSLHMHEFEGNFTIKKKSSLHGTNPADENHVGRTSETVDHTKFQSYRKKAFELKESNMEHLNAQGSSQYGNREEEYNFSLEKRQEMRHAKDRENFSYSGDLAFGKKREQAREQQKEMATYSGDMDLTARDEARREKSKEIATSSGDISMKEVEKHQKEVRKKEKDIANNEGDISMKEVMRKAHEVRRKEKEIANYSGDILVKTLKARDNRLRIKAKKIANWEGDIVVAKKRKGAHPSAAYNGGKVANSYKQKEKYRKRMIKKYGRNPGMETPRYMKEKDLKPRYDEKESQIWDVQKYKESKTKE
jgi:hypothetical protein